MKCVDKFIRFIVRYSQRKTSLRAICAKYSYISFDIFDTLIERKCKNPEEVFSLVEQKYNQSANVEIHGFKKWRLFAEKQARLNSNVEEVTLDDIYRNLTEHYGIKISNQLKNLEIQVELEQCVAIFPNVMIYNQCIDDNTKKVFITSDMYLPKDVIMEILKCNGVKMPQHLYVSCEEQKTKRSGSLFSFLISKNNISKNSMVHIGDNPVSDYFRAKINGIHSYLIL